MSTHLATPSQSEETTLLEHLIQQLNAIRTEMIELETSVLAEQYDVHESHRESARNLVHYLALRRHDLRDIQESLAAHRQTASRFGHLTGDLF